MEDEDRLAMIDDDTYRDTESLFSARVPENRYRQISIVDPPARRDKEKERGE